MQVQSRMYVRTTYHKSRQQQQWPIIRLKTKGHRKTQDITQPLLLLVGRTRVGLMRPHPHLAVCRIVYNVDKQHPERLVPAVTLFLLRLWNVTAVWTHHLVSSTSTLRFTQQLCMSKNIMHAPRDAACCLMPTPLEKCSTRLYVHTTLPIHNLNHWSHVLHTQACTPPSDNHTHKNTCTCAPALTSNLLPVHPFHVRHPAGVMLGAGKSAKAAREGSKGSTNL